MEFAVAGAPGDGLQQIAGCLLSKSVQGGQAPVKAGFLQGFKGFDVQFFTEGPKFFWSEPGEIQEGEQSGWNRGAKLLEIREFSGRDQSGDFFPESLADSRKFAQPVCADEFLKIRRGGLEGSGGGKIGPAFEWVFPLKFKDRADLP